MILTPIGDVGVLVCSESLACSSELGVGGELTSPILVPATETLLSFDERTETLAPLGEIIRSSEFLHAGPNTYPSATTWPGMYGQITGHAFVVLEEDVQTLAVLVEV